MPTRPLLPPVSASHWNTTDQTICAKASVSIARYTPESRTQNQPKTKAPSAASSGASRSEASIGRPSALKQSAAPYAPRPK